MKKMFLLISALLLAGTSMGVNTTWNGSVDSNWMNPANWTGGAIPPAANGLAIRYVATAGATQDVILAATATNLALNLGQEGSRSANGNTLTLNSGANLTLTTTATIGYTPAAGTYSGKGTLIVNSGATLSIAGTLVVGSLAETSGVSSTGTMTLNGGTTTVGGVTRIGSSAAGAAGTSTGTLTIHSNAAFVSTSTGTADIGLAGGNGTMILNGGTASFASTLRLALDAGNTASLKLLGGTVSGTSVSLGAGSVSMVFDKGILLMNTNRISYYNSNLAGKGIVSVIEGGGLPEAAANAMKAQYATGLNHDGNVWWGYDPNTDKTAIWGAVPALSGGVDGVWTGDGMDADWMNPTNWQAGMLSSATNTVSIRYDSTPGVSLDVELAAAVTNTTLYLGQQGSLSASGVGLTLNSGADLTLTDDAIIGYAGAGETISGHGKLTVNAGANLSIGDALTVGHLWSVNEGVNSTATITLNGGTVTVGGLTRIGAAYTNAPGTSAGTLTVQAGGTLISTGAATFDIGYVGEGTLTLNAGTITLSSGLRMAYNIGALAALELLDGTLSASTFSVGSGSSSILLDKGILLINTNRTGLFSTLTSNGIASVADGGGMSTVDSDAMKAQYSVNLTSNGKLWWGYDPVTDKTAFWAGDAAPATGYAAWSAGWEVDIGSETNDYDLDGLINRYEYGLGGNPTNPADRGTSPQYGITNAGGTNRFGYVYPQLAAGLNSGLTYYLEICTNLISGVWTNAGYTVIGTNVTGGDLDFVTNVTGMAESVKFIRLRIE